ncbi:uncharacterized protein PV09_08813 [Verruconis gallopava]|uniref:WLM domain-containing protein n=1 Tax=Verruconis gallopava TaxID=253628 RepID=A0A0D1ZYM9_9PEZI|nr:uncharacterized protein PV09_08813 [Verruconis gallopava]KIV99507.1 hypothetical protein PV09_08813 [Verruconis gallopava]
MRDLDNHFGAYNHLAHLPRADEALFTLRKAASCVKPLMRKRGWRVGILSEFLPDQPNLLGLNTNRGEHIQLRLRHPGDFNQFLPFEQLLDTLLHELCHNVWGPHDENFHNLWNELRDEWETLQMKGFSGEGFLGKGQQLGGSRIPVEEVQRRARAAAQERAKLNKNRLDLGRRLGGSTATAPPRSRTRLRDLIASAAQSRSKINTVNVDSGCATGTQAGNKAAEDALRNGFRTKAEMDDANSIAIAQALQELYEQEEDDRIFEGLSGPPATGGLTWDPEVGLQAIASAPASRSPTPNQPFGSVQHLPNGDFRPENKTTGLKTDNTWQNAVHDVNPHGRPVSRLVREAEAKQRQRVNHGYAKPTPALQNWLDSETGANFGTAVRPRTSSSTDDACWECSRCTFHNHGIMSRCEMCDSPKSSGTSVSALRRKPVSSSSSVTASNATASKPLGWVCAVCGTFMESNWWTCSNCGTMKTSS